VHLDDREGGIVTVEAMSKLKKQAHNADKKQDEKKAERDMKDKKDDGKDEKQSKRHQTQRSEPQQTQRPIFSVPELRIRHAHSLSATNTSLPRVVGVKREPHPVTHSDVTLNLHDPLHGVPHKACPHRDANCLAETLTENKMVHEQQFSRRKKDAVFLRMNDPQRNLLLSRFLAYRRGRSAALADKALLQSQLSEFKRTDPAGTWRIEIQPVIGCAVFVRVND